MFQVKAAALLTGINYVSDHRNRLRGCCNDVRAMGKALSLLLPGVQCTVVTDEDHATVNGTTLQGMLENLQALCATSWQEDLDVAVIQFSGHGTQMKDFTGEEADGLDEVIVPSDVASAGFLSDDDLLKNLWLFNPKTLIFCIMDCCHSGTMMDLPYTYMPGDVPCADAPMVPASGGPRIVCLSGCKDEQTSADAPDAGAKEHRGALTAALLRVMAGGGAGLLPSLETQRAIAADLVARGFRQVPVVSANFDVTQLK